MANRIGIMEHGRLVQIGSPREVYSDPCNIYVATRLGQPAINLVPEGLLEAGAAPEGTATLGVRTEHVKIARAVNGTAQGKVDWIEHLGDQNHLHVSLGEHKLVTLAAPTSDLKRGDKVSVEVSEPLFFGANGQRLR